VGGSVTRQSRSALAEGTDAPASLNGNGAIRPGAAGSRSIAARSVTDA